MVFSIYKMPCYHGIFFEIVNTAANILVANEMKNYEIAVKRSTFS